KTARDLSIALKRLCPDLRRIGIIVTWGRQGGGKRRRYIYVEKARHPASPASLPADSHGKSGKSAPRPASLPASPLRPPLRSVKPDLKQWLGVLAAPASDSRLRTSDAYGVVYAHLFDLILAVVKGNRRRLSRIRRRVRLGGTGPRSPSRASCGASSGRALKA